MSIIIDLVILGILVLCIALGYRRGLTGSLLKIISFALALIIAFVLFKPISNIIIDNTNWDETLEQNIRDIITEDEAGTDSEETEKENQTMSNVMVEYINETVEEAGSEAKEAIADSAVESVAVIIINVGVWVALFILAKIILFFINALTKLVTKLPVIKQFDKLGGIIYGVLEALVVIYGLLAILSLISPAISDSEIINAVHNSFIGSFMYNNNLLLKLIF